MASTHYQKIYFYKRVVQAKLFIDSHYAEQIDLSNIADEAYFSKFHFIRIFRATYGRTPHDYLTRVRIDKAIELLKENKSVMEVCFCVGFNSVTSFAGLFKKIVGQSPSAFQDQQQKLKYEMTTRPLRFIPNCFIEVHGLSEK